MRYRFLGGSQHGKLIAVREGHEYYRAALPEPITLLSHEYTRDALLSYREETYERRPLVFDGYARVFVMALRGMGQAELMRRCADIIEGV